MSDISSTTPSGMTGAGGGNMLRITGMASGLDVDAMVKKMMTSEQMKIDKAKQDQQTIQWKQEAYQGIIKDIKDLQNTYFNSLDMTNNILSSANYAAFDVTSTSTGTSAGTTVATATALTGAIAGTYKLTVNQIAQGASISSNNSLSSQFQVTDIANWKGASKSIAFNVGGTNAAIDLSGFTTTGDSTKDLPSLASYINNQISTNTTLSGKVSASYVQDSSGNNYIKFTPLTSNTVQVTGSSIPDINNNMFKVNDVSNWKNTLEINGTSLDLTGFSGSTVSDLATYINTQINPTVLSGKISAAAVSDLSGNNYIEFTPLNGNTMKITNRDVANTDIPDASLNINLGSPKILTSASMNTTLTSLDSSLNTNLNLNLNYNGTNYLINLDNSNSSTGKKGAATINDLVTKISTATSGQVTAKFDDISGKFVLSTTSTGSTTSLSITNGTGAEDDPATTSNLLSALNLPAIGAPEASEQGKDAIVSITPPESTTATTLTEASNNFTLNSISYTLSSNGDTNISVSANTQKVYDKISGFLDKYNAIVDEIQTKLSEKKDYDYKPLTDAQRASMTASQISAWEDKAKQGILRNDNNLENLLSSMRSAFTTAVSNTGLSFGQYGSNSIGLDTSNDISQGGKITIVDQQKFKAAIAQHGDQILKLFTNVSASDDNTTEFNENGIFQRLNNIFNDNVGYAGTTYNSAILTKYANYQDDYSLYGGGNNTLPDQLYQQVQLLKNLNTEFSNQQEKYYQQFSALETALNQLNSQQSMLSQYGM